MCNTAHSDDSFSRLSLGVDPAKLSRQVAAILANQVGDASSREQRFSSLPSRYAIN
jgi:hypothetical protein